MEIKIDPHALERADERGTNEREMREVINAGFDIPAKHGRTGKAKVYDFKQKRHGKYYEHKRVEVIYTTEKDVAVAVRVCFFHGKRESEHGRHV